MVTNKTGLGITKAQNILNLLYSEGVLDDNDLALTNAVLDVLEDSIEYKNYAIDLLLIEAGDEPLFHTVEEVYQWIVNEQQELLKQNKIEKKLNNSKNIFDKENWKDG